ncbi:MAG: class II aldolase/adducin family protein [Desulfobacterales bacterium]|nr:class II aldolase/adducin family protein [Desulfobacterales bacterium]
METIHEIKNKVLKTAVWLSKNNYFGGRLTSGGNVSARIPREELFAITPSSVPFNEISTDAICLVDFGLNRIQGDLKPPIEAGMHAAIYKRRFDVEAVCHTHQFHASIFSILNTPIPALFDEVTLYIGNEVAVIPYAIRGTEALTQSVEKALENGCFCYIMQNHGALNLGRTLKEALRNAELLERAAKVYHSALGTHKAITTLPESSLSFWDEVRKTL